MTPPYTSSQSNKKNTRVYADTNVRVYGCWSCQRIDVTLRKLGRNRDGLKVYGCPEHLTP